MEYLYYKAIRKNALFFNNGYVFEVSGDLKLKPSFMLKAVSGAPLSIDLSETLY